MAGYAGVERRALCDLMLEVGPDAPTLCQGWTVRDLAAHLVVRERRPDAAPGILVPGLAGYTARVQRSVRDGGSWPDLVDRVRTGPPLLLRPLDDAMNTVELFVHHEDVRRAGNGRPPRDVDPREERALWGRLQMMARLVRRKVPDGLTLIAPGFGRRTVRAGDPHVTITGSPGELLLFMTGRQRAADVVSAGPDDAFGRLLDAKLSL